MLFRSPEGVAAPVQYGERLESFVVYLLHGQLLPEQRVATLIADLFGVALTTATIARISQDCAERLRPFVEAVRDHVAQAPVKHMDETGFRIADKTQRLHIASTQLMTFYRTSSKRGSLLSGVSGIVVHDHWKPYYTLTGVLHALCCSVSANPLRLAGRKWHPCPVRHGNVRLREQRDRLEPRGFARAEAWHAVPGGP